MPQHTAVSYIGHGQTGMRSNMKRFRDLERQSGRAVHTHLEIEARFQMDPAEWQINTLAFSQPFHREFDGAVLDLARVEVSNGEELFRVDTLAECEAEEGSFYYNLDTAFEVYVHLTDDADPSDFEVIVSAVVSVWAGTFGIKTRIALGALPMLGRNLAVDGRVEDWASSTNLTEYTESLNGAGWTVNRDDTGQIAERGTYSVRLSSSGSAAGSAGIRQTISGVVAGKMYLATGIYKTDAANPTTAVARVAVGTTNTIQADGRQHNGTAVTLIDGVQIDETEGEVRRYSFYFIALETNPQINWRLTNSAASACNAWFDDIEVRRVHGFRLSHPRLGAQTEFEEGSADIYPGTKTTGVGGVELINDSTAWAEGLFSADDALGPYFEGAKVTAFFGGEFHDGQEILREDMEPGGTGYIQRLSVSKTRAVLQLESPQSVLDAQLPTRGWPVGDYPDADPRIFDRARGLLFGSKSNITPASYDLSGVLGYRAYEVADCTDAPAGIAAIDAVFAYLDEEAAAKKDNARRELLDSTYDYDADPATGRFVTLANVRVFEVTLDNCTLEFNDGSGVLTAVVPIGCYTLGQGDGAAHDRGLLQALVAAMVTASSTSIWSATYDDSTHLVTLTRTTKGTFELYGNNQPNSNTTILGLLGFDTTATYTGAAAYVGTEVLLTNAAQEHILRVDASGYVDDADGTYTGTPGATIETLAAIAKFVWMAILKQPEPDAESFAAVLASHTEPLAGYLGSLASVQGGASNTLAAGDVFTILENGGFVELSFDSAGVLHLNARTDTPPDNVDTLQEFQHLEELTGTFDPIEVYATVRVNYGQDPSTGFVLGVESFREMTALMSKRTSPRTFDTWHTTEANAAAALVPLAGLARQSIRHFVLVCQGIAMRYKIGDLIQVSAAQALLGVGEAGPGLDSVPFRIFRKRVRSDHVCRLEVHTPVLG